MGHTKIQGDQLSHPVLFASQNNATGETTAYQSGEGLTVRAEIASRILAGFCANPAIFATNPQCGWALVNATDDDLCGYAVRLADTFIDAHNAIDPKAAQSAGEKP